MAPQVKITVTGGTGFIGRRLVKRLLEQGRQAHVLIRLKRIGIQPGVDYSLWDASETVPPIESLSEADAVVHLAGENIAQRWTPAAKYKIVESRVGGTARLVQALEVLHQKPSVLVCASAVGYYGSRGDEILTETSPPGEGFLPEVCLQWEKAAAAAEALGTRVVNLRLGIVFGPEGGMLAKVLPLFRKGLGAKLGSGEQWMSWIHVDDLVNLIIFAIDHPELHGPVNATAPNPVTNAVFTRTLGHVLRRPALFTVPAAVLYLLFGEMAQVMLTGQRALPLAAQHAGFRFEYPELQQALEQLLA
jgi:uncharacterized protein (TIGR01777 family)